MARLLLIFTLILYAATPATADASDFDIRLAHGSARERLAEKQLRRLLDAHDVSPYIVTYSVRIDQNGAPHSHPVLTLNDFYIGDDASALSVFIHEQFHWLGTITGPAVNAAIEDLKNAFPTPPSQSQGGAPGDYATYVHLIVGTQEYLATSSLFSKQEARRVIAEKTWYTWVYRQVLEKEETLLAILQKHGLAP
ncbi:MAG: hypothetical protein COB37_11675 [Kordiimonadales bacterium]|nr:MAG: hypothetical protein COB37_11675 [Kordiimonadales bacterium]